MLPCHWALATLLYMTPALVLAVVVSVLRIGFVPSSPSQTSRNGVRS